MTIRRRISYAAAGIFVLLLLVLLLGPVLFRGRIEQKAKLAVQRNVNAVVDWRDLDLSLLRTFPNLSLQLADLTVVGTGPFARDTLIAVPRFRFVFDLSSVLRNLRGRGPLVVRSIELKRPRAHLIALGNGNANWSIFKEQPKRASSTGMAISLRKLLIDDGRLWVRFADVPYLSGARTFLDAQLDADTRTNIYTLRNTELRLNDLVLRAAGTVRSGNTTNVDVRFDAPRTDFRELLSLVPAIYAHDFKGLETSGSMSASGHVRGVVAKNVLPAFVIKAAVQNGAFKYPDLPLPTRDINLALQLANPGGDVDRTVLDISRFHFVLGNDPMDGSLLIRTPRSDPEIGLRLAGRIDLANVPRTIKLDSVKELSGLVVANASVRARRSDVDRKRYERINASGGFQITRMALNAASVRQPIRIDEADVQLSPQRAELVSFRGRAGSSDLDMKGSLDNLIGFLIRRDVLQGTLTASSHSFNLDEWRSDDELKKIDVPGNIDFALNATADTVKYGALVLRNARGKVHIKDRRATLEDFSMETLGGAIKVGGYYETIDSVHPSFDVAVDFDEADIPAAFAALRTVQAFAPVARYAQGQFSARMRVGGQLGKDMMPMLSNLTASGSLVTNGLVLRSFPPLNKLADVAKLPLLRDPGFVDLKSSFSIDKGRLAVRPFDVKTGALTMNVSGSNGIDQTLDYALALRLPNASLGTARIGGTVTNPTVKLDLRQAIDTVVDKAALKLIAEAEKQATVIREQADSLAARMKREGYAQADSLEAKATGVKKIAARIAANRLRKETDAKADALVREANTRSQKLVDDARAKVKN